VLNAVELVREAGLELDPWQDAVFRGALNQGADEKRAALEVGLVVPRQNGKGTILEAIELEGLFLDPNCRLILHSAHEVPTAHEAFLRLIEDLKASDWLYEHVERIRYANGEAGVDMVDGKRIRFHARSSGSRRGFSGDRIILDEAFNLPDAAIAAMYPTLSARVDPQVWFASSAPLLHPVSDVLRRIIRRGRAGLSPDRLAYFEWCADEDAVLDDRAAWAQANPGLGIRLNERVIEGELGIMTPENFALERLGIFPDDIDEVDRIIPAEAWSACEDAKSKPTGFLFYALDVSPQRDWASIAVAAASDCGGIHVEVIDRRAGTDWLVARAVKLQGRHGGKVVVAKGSPAWSLKDDLEVAKVDLLPISTEEHSQACGDLYDAVIEARLRHIDQDELNTAVGGADRRYYGDAWLWSRRTSSVDISPLVAVTLAHWVAQKRQRKPKIQWRGVD
jgi:phage terminase large subunit-like protein